MRNILMVGTAQAQAPYADGVESFVPEDVALTLHTTGELAFVWAADGLVNVEARKLELQAMLRMKALQMWANVNGSRYTSLLGETYVLPPVGEAAEYRERNDVLKRAESPRYG